MREAVRVGRAADVRFEPVQGLSNSLLSLLESAPSSIGQLLPLLMKRRMGRRPNPGSTLQSIRRGQPTEIDYLNGAIVRRGAALGVLTPVSSEIVRMVHEVEASATFIAPATVVGRARSARG
jgi:2-dehydropantoate 2-reductase